MPEALTPSVQQAYAFCEQMAKSHYENFPVGSFLIPKERRRHVWAVYAFARTADDFADEGRDARETPESLQKRLAQLDDWEYKLLQAGKGQAEHPIFVAVAETLKDAQIPVQLLKDLLTAYRMDVQRKRYKSFEDLFFYCKHSANPVGRLVLHIMNYKDESIHLLSDHICTALQLANFWQDVAIDLAKDRIYLPEDEMRRFRVTEGDLHAKICNRAFQTLMQFCSDKTASLFNQGLPLTQQVGRDLRWEMRLTWLGGTTILKKLSQNHFDIYRNRPKIGLMDKVALLSRALLPMDLKPI